jgi:hypothetical protein
MNQSEKAPVATGATTCEARQDSFDYLRIIGVLLVTVQHVLTLTDRPVRQFHFSDDR